MTAGLVDRRTVLVGLGAGLVAAAAPADWRTGLTGVVASGARVREVYRGGLWCEGPLWDRRTGALLFSDVRRDRMMRLGADGIAEPFRDPSGYANGNCFDRSGRLITCEHGGRRVVRLEADGRLTVLADRYGGGRLNSPNDAVAGRDGAVWFTDPTFGIDDAREGRQSAPEQKARRVYRIDPGGAVSAVADDLEQPNGLAFSPDERVLYVADASGGPDNPEGKREVRAFEVRDSKLTGGRVFATLPSGTPDGLKVDAEGRVYAATDAGAAVWSAAGEPLGVIPTPERCANLAFGGPDGRRLYLCCGPGVHAVETTTRGATWTG